MLTKATKTVVAVLVLAGASITLVANASAAQSRGPAQASRGISQAEQNWMDRASAPDTERNAFGY
ncbi:MAG: hypothetical protein JO328_20685 [Hyphomicrobiales bacterium]|nr:hypothetical protein [Hyphomicrobiales bacterium]MBV9429393.1 hypothetical protein [Bradyrhizobiaceae bacterium]